MRKALRNILATAAIAAIAMATCSLPASAETVSQKHASIIASRFLSKMRGTETARTSPVYNGKRLTTDRLFTPFYVFNSPSGGFVIVAAENKAFPILAWSPSHIFDANKEPTEIMALLKQYAFDIERIRYDATPVDDAIKAWQNIDGYIDDILTPKINIELPSNTYNTADDVNNILWNDEMYVCTSDIYTPSQWQDMVTDHLKNGNVLSLGLLTSKSNESMSVSRMSGDYFGMDLSTDHGSNRYDAWFRLSATEALGDAQVAAFIPTPTPKEDPEATYIPFAEQDAFISAALEASIQEPKTEESSVKLSALGGGRYMITLPNEARLARIYNLSGSLVRQYTYRGQNNASIDIAPEPAGFYFVTIIDAAGTPYGLKLVR